MFSPQLPFDTDALRHLTAARTDRESCIESAQVASAARSFDPSLRDLARERLAERDFVGYLSLFSSDKTTAAFADIAPLMSEEEFVATARAAWADDDQPSANAWFWATALIRVKNRPDVFMDETERQILANLSSPQAIYRGCGPEEARPSGVAWTLDLERARFFAFVYGRGGRQPGHGRVFRAYIDPRCAIACLGQRKEAEILVPPTEVMYWETIEESP